eukprot:c27917_g4_i1 orf=258-431(+)
METHFLAFLGPSSVFKMHFHKGKVRTNTHYSFEKHAQCHSDTKQTQHDEQTSIKMHV